MSLSIEQIGALAVTALAPVVAWLTARYTRSSSKETNRTADWSKFHELVEQAVDKRIVDQKEMWREQLQRQDSKIEGLRERVVHVESQLALLSEKYWDAIHHIRVLRPKVVDAPDVPARIREDV